MTRVSVLSALLELHASSASLQAAHERAVESGDVELAAEIHRAGELVARCIGLLVVSEARRTKLAAVTA